MDDSQYDRLVDLIVADTYDNEDDTVFDEGPAASKDEVVDDGGVVGSAADLDLIVADTYDNEDDFVFDEGPAASKDKIVDDGGVVGSAADMDMIVADTYDSEDDTVFDEGLAASKDEVVDDGGVVGSAADMDMIVTDTYDSEDDTVFDEGPAASKDEVVLGLNVRKEDEVMCSVGSEKDEILGCLHVLQKSSKQGQTAPKQFLLPDLNLPSAEDVLQRTTFKADRDFDLNKLPIRGPPETKLSMASFLGQWF